MKRIGIVGLVATGGIVAGLYAYAIRYFDAHPYNCPPEPWERWRAYE